MRRHGGRGRGRERGNERTGKKEAQGDKVDKVKREWASIADANIKKTVARSWAPNGEPNVNVTGPVARLILRHQCINVQRKAVH